MTWVLQLSRETTSRVDTGVRLRLEATVGVVRSREILSDACFEIVERLTRFELAVAAGQRGDAARLADDIAAVAAQIGLPELSQAAIGAAACLEGGDVVARRATQQRLIRVGEASLDALLDGAAPQQV